MTQQSSLLRAACPLIWLAVVLSIACEAPLPEPDLGRSASALTWTVADRLNAGAGRTKQGEAMALSGDWLAVESRVTGTSEGVVSLYERVSGSFVLRQELTASAFGFTASSYFGDAL